MIPVIFAIFLLMHGVAHLVGFVVPWRITTLKEMPYKTTILVDAIDVGDNGIRAVGILWLTGALAFVASAVGLFTLQSWWQSVTVASAAFSFFLCIVGLPDSRIGLFVNMVILVSILVGGPIV